MRRAHASGAVRRAFAAAFVLACALVPRMFASAEWRPADVHATKTPRADVLAAYAKANGPGGARFAQRRERWTYANGVHRFAVRVAVRGGDFRADMALGDAHYAAGRANGVRWRADGNGIAHATLSDDQGDALDRLPQSTFPYALADCELAGESDRFGAAWVLVDRAPHDRPHWLYVDETTGLVTHEITREGARTNVTAFDRFEPLDAMQPQENGRTARRPRHWRTTSGDAALDLDVTVDAVEPQPVAAADVAVASAPRTFAAPSPPADGVVPLPVHFRGRTIFVDVVLGGRTSEFVLDTGTASITLDSRLAARAGWKPVLEHATVPQMTAGPLALANVSALAIPLDLGYDALGGILGYDFFAGNVVHVDYAARRVEVLTPRAAEPVFRDPRNTVVDARFDEGIPLVRAAFGAADGEFTGASGDRFTLDTGSPHLYVLAPFERRNAAELARWAPARFRGGRTFAEPRYLEGSIAVVPRSAPAFALGPLRFPAMTVGVEASSSRPDALDIALDGIVGTDEMSAYAWWFDYDGGRIAVRRNDAH